MDLDILADKSDEKLDFAVVIQSVNGLTIGKGAFYTKPY
jgi:hypothetical protein